MSVGLIIRTLALASICLGLGMAEQADAAVTDGQLLHPIFTDHAVLQRDKPIPVYGLARPGEDVTVSLGAASVVVKADGTGHWSARLPPAAAGGPYTLIAKSSDRSQSVHDVMLGDVFLCSGQSNMQLQVKGAGFAPLEISAANDDQIRYFPVPRVNSFTPLETFTAPAAWQVTSPKTAGDFSAACYFFGREMRRDLNVPIGLVASAWGGTRIREWVSEPTLSRLPEFRGDIEFLNLYRTDPEAAMRRWNTAWESWWHSHAGADSSPWNEPFSSPGWNPAPAGLGSWGVWGGLASDPDGQSEPGVGYTGQMWLRTSFTATAAQAEQSAVLSLGNAQQEDETWINGTAVGANSGAADSRHDLPKGILHAGVNTVVTNLYCSWKNCGLIGPDQTRLVRFADSSSVTLDQAWQYRTTSKSFGIAPQLPWGLTHGLIGDYGGMIAPIGTYGLRGAIWYQGESNIPYVKEYRAALPALMSDWRRLFGADLPFLIVQLPNYGRVPTHPVSSGWSDIREAQRLAVQSDSHAALVVTIDIGDAGNMHPPNKQELGRRLAIAARHLIYGEAIAPSGPIPQDVVRVGHSIRITFADVNGNLQAYSGIPTSFEACDRESCRYVPATLQGQVVTLPASSRTSSIRYCWGDSPTCTLHDSARLPAGPFEWKIH